ncbi:MAG TPA: DUF305 domain-containing protein [Gemmatimonadaceae bacterium]|nr:DUF305 domain-containing protein [Gemmatimonadaceae bacterium]
MNTSKSRRVIAALLVVASAAACAKSDQQTQAAESGHQHGVDASQITIPKGAVYRVADVQFMQGMIAHHAQAIFMTQLAESRTTNARLLFLARKIDQSQMPEITLMQDWLARNEQHVPDTSSYHSMHMPGMLTLPQVDSLKGARGAEFDRQFLALMIQHHEGAIQMVKDLFATKGAAQDPDVSGFAGDVDQVQTAEIDLMRRMLADL